MAVSSSPALALFLGSFPLPASLLPSSSTPTRYLVLLTPSLATQIRRLPDCVLIRWRRVPVLLVLSGCSSVPPPSLPSTLLLLPRNTGKRETSPDTCLSLLPLLRTLPADQERVTTIDGSLHCNHRTEQQSRAATQELWTRVSKPSSLLFRRLTRNLSFLHVSCSCLTVVWK